MTLLLIAVLEVRSTPRLSEFFEAASYPLAHGRNIVNVILVDFRGLDTLGEIAVVMTAGIAVLALLRAAGRSPAEPEPAEPRRRSEDAQAPNPADAEGPAA